MMFSCLAIQMGRPTKYTSSSSAEVRSGSGQISHEGNVAISRSSNSSTSHVSCAITSWYQSLSARSLLQRYLLVPHHSVNPWLMTSPDVSLSPDSTVKELEQSSSDGEDVMKQQCDVNGAVNLSHKPAASPSVCRVPRRSSLMSQTSATISTSSNASAMNCHESLQSQIASHWSHHRAMSSIAALVNNHCKHTAEPVLNLSVKPLQLCLEKSASVRRPTITTLPHTVSENDSSGSVLYFMLGSSFVNEFKLP